MNKIYGKLNMSWLFVICFAVITGVYTGVIMLIPALKDTSFQDIGISYEWWVIFAVIVVVNCKTNIDAMLKCFVFFLISQPLVYLVEIIFGSLTFNQAWIYYKFWLFMTILVIPGGFIAFFCKKQNLLGSIILGLGNTIQAVMALYYLAAVTRNFPHHILSVIVCVASIFVMSFHIQKEKKYRIISIVVAVVMLGLLVIFAKVTGRALW